MRKISVLFSSIVRWLFARTRRQNALPASTLVVNTIPATVVPSEEATGHATATADLSWMRPDADIAKLNLVGRQAGEELRHEYLWYVLGDIDTLTEDELLQITTLFFIDGIARFGDIELHASDILPNEMTILRIRGHVRLLPSFELRGHRCALYAVGHGSDRHYVNFHEVWNRPLEQTQP
jgi:hypothetical protein